MDLIALFLGVLLAGLGETLAGIAALAAGRYGDQRLYFVVGAFAVLGLVGILAVIAQLSSGELETLDIGSAPLGLLVVSTALLYLSVVRGRTPPKS